MVEEPILMNKPNPKPLWKYPSFQFIGIAFIFGLSFIFFGRNTQNNEPVKKYYPPVKLVKFDIKGLKIGDTVKETKDSDKLEGIDAKINYTWKDKKLIGVRLTFASNAFPTIVQIFTEKFGCPPDDSYTEDYKTVIGATFTNERVKWHTENRVFELKKYDTDIRTGCGTLDNSEMEEYLKTEYEKNFKNLKKQF